MSEPAGPGTGPSCHTGGSRSFAETWRDIELSTGKEPNIWDFYKRTHCKKGEEFVDGKAKKVAADVEARIEAAMQSGQSLSDSDQSQAFMDVAGGVDKKRRVYGLGAVGSSLASSSSNSATSVSNQDQIRKEIEEQVVLRVEAMRDEIQAEMEARMEATMDSRVQSRIQVVTLMLEQLRNMGVIPPLDPSPTLQDPPAEDDDVYLGDK